MYSSFFYNSFHQFMAKTYSYFVYERRVYFIQNTSFKFLIGERLTNIWVNLWISRQTKKSWIWFICCWLLFCDNCVLIPRIDGLERVHTRLINVSPHSLTSISRSPKLWNYLWIPLEFVHKYIKWLALEWKPFSQDNNQVLHKKLFHLFLTILNSHLIAI